MHSRPHNIIFDWSGTLVDDIPPVLEATNAVMRAFGRAELSREEFRAQFRLPFLHWYEEILPGVTVEELDRIFLAAFAESQQPVTVLPHALEFLEHCADEGRRLLVLSSAPQFAVEAQARALGLHGYFEHFYAGLRDKRDHIARVLDERSLAREHTLLIGDMRHDIHTARAGGITSVAVLTGYEYPEVIATAEPDVTVNDLAELRSLWS